MRISQVKSTRILIFFFQEQCIEKVLSWFKVDNAKPKSTPSANHKKLSNKQSRKIAEEHEHMANIPYASIVGNSIYAMVCTRPDITHVM